MHYKVLLVSLTFLSSVIMVEAQSGSGFYTNPIICADYSDPDVECVNGEYWMVSSSFNCVPGLQILHSWNLVDWEIVNAAIPAGSHYWGGALDSPDHGNGVWAPSIRYRASEGRFYIFWGDPDRGIFQVNASEPLGKWTEPVCVISGKGLIDPCPLFDDDGRVYLVHAWAGSRAGFKSILTVCELNCGCTAATGEQIIVFDGNKNENLTVEGPKFYRRDGAYWILAPAGGVKTGWQLALRSGSPFGPYEWRRVCEAADGDDIAAGRAADTRAPHQGAMVCDTEGRDWFLHFEDRHAWGRVVHLQPVSWTADGWCVIGQDIDEDGIGEPVSSYRKPAGADVNGLSAEAVTTCFTGISIPLNWQWHGDPSIDWCSPNPSEGCLRLNCILHRQGWRNLWDTPNLLLEKVVAPHTELTARLVFRPSYAGDRVGMVVMGTDYGTIEMHYDGENVLIERRDCRNADKGTPETVQECITMNDRTVIGEKSFRTVYLKVDIHGKKRCDEWPPVAEYTFFYSLNGKDFIPFGPSGTLTEGKWIGAKTGFFATSDIRKNDGGSVEIH